MIQITPQMHILLAVEPVDFRCGIDGLARVCREVLKTDPFVGWVFVFRSRRGTAIRTLAYDGQGFWLCQKRLSTGRFRYWPGGPAEVSRALEAHELQVLLAGGNPCSVSRRTGMAPRESGSVSAEMPHNTLAFQICSCYRAGHGCGTGAPGTSRYRQRH